VYIRLFLCCSCGGYVSRVKHIFVMFCVQLCRYETFYEERRVHDASSFDVTRKTLRKGKVDSVMFMWSCDRYSLH